VEELQQPLVPGLVLVLALVLAAEAARCCPG